MKKLVSLVLVVVLVLAGCGGGASQTDDKVTIFNLKVEIDAALKAYAKTWSEETGIEVEVKSVGGGADYNAGLQAEFQSGSEPDIFVAAGKGDFDTWAGVTYDMSDEEWVDDTTVEFINDNDEVVGFPIAIEGYGLIVNTDILQKGGIDYSDVKTTTDLTKMFESLDSQKDKLGIDAVLSTTTKETWLTGDQLHSVLLGGSGSTNDESKENIAKFIDGDAEALNYDGYADYVNMLYTYAYGDPSIIDYDTQVSNFANGKTAVLQQGNWIIPNLESANFDTSKLAFIPHMYNENTEGRLNVDVPSYYAVNKNTDTELALQFLNDMAETEAGHEYMVNEAKMVPAFNNVEIAPADPLSAQVLKYYKDDMTMGWLFQEFPTGYTQTTYAPFYDNFSKTGDSDAFINNIKDTAGNVD